MKKVQSEPTYNEKRCTALDLRYRIGKINELQREFFHTVIRHDNSKTLKFAKSVELIKVHTVWQSWNIFTFVPEFSEVADFC